MPSTQRRIRNTVIGALIGVEVGATIDQTWGTRLRNESSGDGGRGITYAAWIGALGGSSQSCPRIEPSTDSVSSVKGVPPRLRQSKPGDRLDWMVYCTVVMVPNVRKI